MEGPKILNDETKKISPEGFKQEQRTLFCNRTNHGHGTDLCSF